jgi:hypothetical protein
MLQFFTAHCKERKTLFCLGKIMKIKILALILALALLFAVCTAKVYRGQNMGLVWSWGGIELVGAPGLFICNGQC